MFTILTGLQKQNKLTEQIVQRIRGAESLTELEDLVRNYPSLCLKVFILNHKCYKYNYYGGNYIDFCPSVLSSMFDRGTFFYHSFSEMSRM